MAKRIVIIVFIICLSANFAYAQANYDKDLRAVRLKIFLDRYPFSPLRGHEQEILYCADKFNLDYRLYVAIAGAESTFGKKYPKATSNLTGYNSCNTTFDSIYKNIYETHKLIGTAKWYKKYRQTRKIEDLVYTYKGVPPYAHYIRNIRYTLDAISAIPIKEEKKKAEQAYIKNRIRQAQQEELSAWGAIQYDDFEAGEKSALNREVAQQK
ncbi:MAG: hypothetical protein KKB81_02885 [Candidatus Margulisbacteria bacterium]|nr:hypothetical protein [Candidatus Margulisiibacteriota bacterium]MBU1022193.1 hypothetical protein [Candidatus Margulisiibacteriota bacterium]MBU1729368.1 hypothetical protein [Candidatus Margulisiibacteriota bacterium]MBU1955641.1 hypothetical protein [Candidatus Margulisiibacteriota bacterium]